MPMDQRNQYHMRFYIIDKLKAYTSGIWADIAHQTDGQTISELLDTAVAAVKHDAAKAVQSSVFRPPIATVNLQETKAPFYKVTISESTDGKPAEA
jgi:HD superfamily phosphohydrolase YqeK